MIKRLRLNFIVIAMGALIILLLAIFATINLYMQQVALEQVDSFLQDVTNNNGDIRSPFQDPQPGAPSGPNKELQFITGFSLLVSLDGEQVEVLNNQGELTDEVISGYALQVIHQKTFQGDLDGYRYLVEEKDDGFLMVFASTSLQNVILSELLRLSYVIGGISLLILLLVISRISGLVTKPVEEAFEKQKRFIADSSHELKTPLSIISANIQMLEMEIGENSRLSAMSHGVKRMNTLIHELLILARTEASKVDFMPFNLSRVMESTILPLEVIAYEHQNTLDLSIEENIELNGNEEGIRKMIGALMENAIKYSKNNTEIQAKLYKKGESKIIEVFNEGIGVTKEQKSQLFDKFYRVDHSRDRESGGHGIGLSIVKNVVEQHHGKILVESQPNVSILFKVILHG